MGAKVGVAAMIKQAATRGAVDDPRVDRVLVAIHGDEFYDDELDDDESDVRGRAAVDGSSDRPRTGSSDSRSVPTQVPALAGA